MKRPADRRIVLMAVGAAAISVVTGPAAAQAADIRGVVTFNGGAVIPEGHLEIYLNDPASQDNAQRRVGKTRVISDGKSQTIAFSLPLPVRLIASPTLQLIVRLERADGWLIARGSTQFVMGSPTHVTLNAVMY